jgi:4-amino-4-deoxy-L-arabinose transferase-like glycosyltransferase
MALNWYKDKLGCAVLFLISLVLFSRTLDVQGLEYRDDEIFYVQSTQEMIASHQYVSPTYFGEHRFQKPILFYWLILLSYKIYGVSWLGARAVSCLFGALTVSLTWLLARDFFGRKIANLSGAILMTLPMFWRHAKNAVPDMPMNFCIVCAMFCVGKIIFLLDRDSLDKSDRLWLEVNAIMFFIAIGIGFMMKGPAAIVVPIVTVLAYGLVERDARLLRALSWGRGCLIFFMIVVPWFAVMASKHGMTFVHFLFEKEAKFRAVGPDRWTFGGWIIATARHIVFYLGNMLSYFAPWSVFGFVGIPSVLKYNRLWLERHWRMTHFLLIWMLVVLAFFSVLSFRVNHYLLVLTTPFAIFTGLFFLEKFDRKKRMGRVLFGFQKYMSLVIFLAGIAAVILLQVILLDQGAEWAIGLTLIALIVSAWILLTPWQRVAPWVLAVMLMIAFANARLLADAGLTSLSRLRQFAAAIQQRDNGPSAPVIIVGSNQLHEKEFQIFFKQKVLKPANSSEEQTQDALRRLLASPGGVYCLIREEDYQHYLVPLGYGFSRTSLSTGAGDKHLELLEERTMVRRKMHLDRSFFDALLRLDRPAVYPYLMENVLLVFKPAAHR